ncbi:hypothetical protein SLS56_011893 [Neofusicoccum ribis]|uniref:Uncharacterized protein n=1 Tax=Neofusicoccum ribis TaxID=45134 RepID=A0ABR3SAZ2_9PEZI
MGAPLVILVLSPVFSLFFLLSLYFLFFFTAAIDAADQDSSEHSATTKKGHDQRPRAGRPGPTPTPTSTAQAIDAAAALVTTANAGIQEHLAGLLDGMRRPPFQLLLVDRPRVRLALALCPHLREAGITTALHITVPILQRASMDGGDHGALLILKRDLAACAAALWMMTLAPFTPTPTEAFDSAVVAFTQRLGPVHPVLLVLHLVRQLNADGLGPVTAQLLNLLERLLFLLSDSPLRARVEQAWWEARFMVDQQGVGGGVRDLCVVDGGRD